MLTQTDTVRVYWLGDFAEPVTVALNKWEKYIRAQCPKAREPTLDYHCTMYYDVSKSGEFDKRWERHRIFRDKLDNSVHHHWQTRGS